MNSMIRRFRHQTVCDNFPYQAPRRATTESAIYIKKIFFLRYLNRRINLLTCKGVRRVWGKSLQSSPFNSVDNKHKPRGADLCCPVEVD